MRTTICAALTAVVCTACAPDPSRDADVDWPVHGGTTQETRFSPLAQINRDTIAALTPAWFVEFDTNRGQEATPLVVDGVLYTTTAWSKVYAVSAKTGERLWYFDPKVPGATGYKACCDVNSRGPAVADGKVFVAALDGRLIALDAKTGTELWSTVTVDRSQPYTITGAPRFVKGKVVIGNSGGEFGVRGYVSAYDAASGELAWRFYVVPGDPAKGPDGAASDDALARIALPTWFGKWYEYGGGGTVWDAIVYDEELDQLYVGTGNGSPWNRHYRSDGQGDNLFLSSILALDPDTGEYLWHYQESPGESWDFTSVQPIMLADLTIAGEPRKALLHAPKNGFFYVLDRRTGKVISANNFVPVNWATHVDLATGRPAIAANAYYDDGPFVGTPTGAGAHNWSPWSYSTRTGLVYFQAAESWLRYADDPDWVYVPGGYNTGIDRGPDQTPATGPNVPPPQAYVLAWDPVANRERWRIDGRGGGVLATAGDLLFQGKSGKTGELVAYDARNGEKVWSYATPNPIVAAPISYSVDGEQYIALVSGRGFYGSDDRNAHTAQPGRLIAFKLGGTATLPDGPLPPPPARPPDETFADDVVRAGELLYFDHCGRCHGTATRSLNIIPDLRRSPALGNAELWRAIVIDGTLTDRGMVGFAQFVDASQAESIRAYVARQAVALAQEEIPSPYSPAAMRLPHEDYHLRHLAKLAVVTTPPFIAALALLLLNDLLLKGHYGNWVTGKLSDVAGLMVVTLLAAPFAADRPKRLCVALALAFGYWKSPWSQPLIDLVNEHSPILVTRVVDYTDLLALAVVPAAFWLFRSSAVMRIEPSLLRRLAMAPVLALVVVAITGTSAPTGYTRTVVAERSPIAAEPPSAASIAKGALEQRGYTCSGVYCTDDDTSVRLCESNGRLALIVTGPTNGGMVGPTTGHFKRKQVDALVTELRSALEPRFAVTTDDQDYRNKGPQREIGEKAFAFCEAIQNEARAAGGGA